jgi:hypothetical protein
MKAPYSCLLLSCAVACGGAGQPAGSADEQHGESNADVGSDESAAAEGGSDEASGDDEQEQGIPKKCFKGDDPCLPSPRFVDALCNDTYYSATLHLFSSASPFTRAYLKGKVKAWNASGGVSDNEAWLEFDEEVVLLKKRGGPQGIQVSGAEGGYDAIRWDGSCVTLDASEVTLSKPPSPKAAKVEWRFLDGATQEALRSSAEVTEAFRSRRQECKGAVSGTVSKKCVKADDLLSQVIVDYVRGGGNLGTPERLP